MLVAPLLSFSRRGHDGPAARHAYSALHVPAAGAVRVSQADKRAAQACLFLY